MLPICLRELLLIFSFIDVSHLAWSYERVEKFSLRVSGADANEELGLMKNELTIPPDRSNGLGTRSLEGSPSVPSAIFGLRTEGKTGRTFRRFFQTDTRENRKEIKDCSHPMLPILANSRFMVTRQRETC